MGVWLPPFVRYVGREGCFPVAINSRQAKVYSCGGSNSIFDEERNHRLKGMNDWTPASSIWADPTKTIVRGNKENHLCERSRQNSKQRLLARIMN